MLTHQRNVSLAYRQGSSRICLLQRKERSSDAFWLRQKEHPRPYPIDMVSADG